MATSTEPTPPAVLQGTPVVPGVAFGPALLVRGEISPEAIERFGAGQFADAEAALAAYDDAAGAVADGFSRKADKASGAAAEVLTASAGLARDKGLRGAVRKQLNAGEHLVASVARGRRPVRRDLHPDGRPDGRTGHRPARHRTPDRGPRRRRTRTRRPDAEHPLRPRRRRSRPLGHGRPRSGRHPGTGHRARRAHQPHGHHRPPARHPVRGRHRGCPHASWPAPRCSSTARPARCRPASRSPRPRRSSPRTQSSGPPRRRGPAPGGPPTARA